MIVPSRGKNSLRRFQPLALAVLLGTTLLAACGGGSSTPTPVPAIPTATAPAASPAAATAASPVTASPESSPVAASEGSPVAGKSSGSSTMTRAEFRQQLLAKYPMSVPGKTGGRVVLGEAADISTLNGILTQDSPTIYVTGSIYEALVGVSPIDGQAVPSLADSWEVSADGLTYTFHLNTNAKWHDGADFTAEDVKFSYDAVLDPNTGSAYTSTVNDAVLSYRIVDADTFEIVARDRLVSFLYDAPGTVLIMPKHLWESVGFESWTFDGGSTGLDPARVVGTGPFKFKEWVQGDHVTLVRNADYYDGPPVIDEFILTVQPDETSAVLALQNGETDLLEIIPPNQMESVQSTEGLAVEIYDFYQFTFYGLNVDASITPLFQDKAVRQAMFMAIDRDSITENIFLGYGEAAVGTQPKLSPAYSPNLQPPYTFDPQAARDLLASAGWTDTNDNGTVDRDGVELKFSMIAGDGSDVTKQILAYMQEAWSEVGIKMEADIIDFSTLITRLQQRDFEATFLAFSLSPNGDQTALFSCDAINNGLNFMGFCNPEWDRLNEEQRSEFDAAKRTELLVSQSQVVWDEQPIGVLRFGVARTGYSTRLHNFHPNGYGFLWSLPYVWVD